MDVKDILKNRRLELQYTLDDVARMVGVSGATISRWESGDIANMKRDKIVKLANALQVKPAVIMGWDDPSPAASVGPIGHYRIPVVATVAAGFPIFSEENVEYYIDYDKDPHGSVFCCRIKGDSMDPRIMDGDIIVVDKESAWDDGDIVLVTVNGNEGTCKRIMRFAEGIQLLSINQNYQPMFYSKDEVEQLPVKVVGKVVEQRRKL